MSNGTVNNILMGLRKNKVNTIFHFSVKEDPSIILICSNSVVYLVVRSAQCDEIAFINVVIVLSIIMVQPRRMRTHVQR